MAINPPHFDENKPLRDRPPVVNTVSGVIAILRAGDLADRTVHYWNDCRAPEPPRFFEVPLSGAAIGVAQLHSLMGDRLGQRRPRRCLVTRASPGEP